MGQKIHAEQDMFISRAVVGSLSFSTNSTDAETDGEPKGTMRVTPSL